MKQERLVLPVALLFKGKEELNFQNKGQRGKLGSLSFQSFEGTECRFFKTLQVASQDGRKERKRGLWDLKPGTERI